MDSWNLAAVAEETVGAGGNRMIEKEGRTRIGAEAGHSDSKELNASFKNSFTRPVAGGWPGQPANNRNSPWEFAPFSCLLSWRADR